MHLFDEVDVQMFCCPYCDRIEFQDEDHYFEHVTMCDAQFEEDYDLWSDADPITEQFGHEDAY